MKVHELEFASVAEAVQMLNVTQRRIKTLLKDDKSFPRPYFELGVRPIWKTEAILAYKTASDVKYDRVPSC